MKYLFLILLGMGSALSSLGQETVWKHLSTKTGDLEAPNQNQQQTATAVFDVDKDGILDFLIAERTGAPGLVWYKKKPTKLAAVCCPRDKDTDRSRVRVC